MLSNAFSPIDASGHRGRECFGELSSEPLAIDGRPRRVDCGEPLGLERESDAESWIRADDANCFGDHTARVN